MDVGTVFPARLIRACLQLLAGVLLALASPALAAEASSLGRASTCHAYADNAEAAQLLRESTAGWVCQDRDWHATTRYALLRFELGADGRVPAEYASRLARFEALQVYLERADGTVSLYGYSPRDFVQRGHMRMVLALPEAGSRAVRVTVVLVGPTAGSLVHSSRLQDTPIPLLGVEQLWIALLCGLLLVPLIFNLALFRALKDRFLLWHTGLVAFMLGHTLLTSGLLPMIMPVPVGAVALLIPLGFCGGAACVLMLIGDFVERDKLAPIYRRALAFAAVWLLLDAAFFVGTIDWLQGRGLAIYLTNWLVVAAVLIVTIGSALSKGSRAAKFLAASLLPLIVTGLWQIGESVLGDQTEPMLMFVAQRLAIGAEVLITSIGIADRFIQLRRDRDDHRELASELTRLAERDPLTGLLNRRAIEERFAVLRAKGFATLALLDLDHFKAVNDRFGHAIGDDVLRSVAAALPEDSDALAVRMGGEEFMLLLRGSGAMQRAEQVRQALTARVAREVPGLDRPMTSSMGLVEIPAEVMPNATFASIYARADGLLYQAKRTGRNRTVSERMTMFARRRSDRGAVAA